MKLENFIYNFYINEYSKENYKKIKLKFGTSNLIFIRYFFLLLILSILFDKDRVQ